MRALAAAFFAWAVLSAPCGAQPVGAFVQGSTAAAPTGFQGTCNVVAGCTNAYGLIAPTAAAAASNAASFDWSTVGGFCSSGGTGHFDSTTGLTLAADLASMTAACGAFGGMSKYYDLAGSVPLTTAATGSGAPAFIQTAANCSPNFAIALECAQINAGFKSTANFSGTAAQPFTVVVFVGTLSSPGATTKTLVATDGPSIIAGLTSAQKPNLNAGSSQNLVGAVSNGALHVIIGAFDGASSEICVDGTRTALVGSIGVGTLNGLIYVGNDASGSDGAGNNILMAALYAGTHMSAVNQGLIWANAKTNLPTFLSGAGTCS